MNRAGMRPLSPELVAGLGFAALLLLLASVLLGLGRDPADALRAADVLHVDGAQASSGYVLLPGHPGEVARARLHWDLPPRMEGDARWVVWVPRVPVDRLQFSGTGWVGPEHDFFRPRAAQAFPGGFRSVPPEPAGSALELDLHLVAAGRLGVLPLLVREDHAVMLEQRASAMSAAVYAVLLVLALLALALYAAARDSAFLSYFACAMCTLLLLAALNGHLYRFAGLSFLGTWRTQGVQALILVFLLAWTRLLEVYAGATLDARARNVLSTFRWTVLVLIALCLANLPAFNTYLGTATRLLWVTTGIAGVGWMTVAVRRRLAMAWPLLVLHVLTYAALLAHEFSPAWNGSNPLLARFAFQAGMVTTLTLFAVGLVSRIADFRDQRDRDRLARLDSERRMAREAARGAFAHALQAGLRTLSPGDIEWTAFRLLFDHLLPLLPVQSAVAVAQGFHGAEMLVVHPTSGRDEALADLERRALPLKRAAAAGLPRQELLGNDQRARTEALLPLQVRAPGWGAVLLRRDGSEGFAAEEMALAMEFTRLAQLHVEQAVVTANLRRSAEMDALTGSLNRRSVDQWLLRCFNEAERDGQPLSVILVDLDHFKSINDQHGHVAGDHCLRTVAAALRKAVGEGALFGRYGGEEFIGILPGVAAAPARETGERMRSAVEHLDVRWEEKPLRLTVSVGLATRREGERSPQDTVDRADKALYAAKRLGRNCVQVAPAVFT
ncbi:diguanylate cyclase [Luteimonas yindakuii]|uniref:sensor domain-containing diguanylate cyclase n=1 Tax=Luteimonas yindakuii TaxID=2565782 RepID=UPI0010A4A02A|nr:GGDEF domain-containing protein [Luteimonas yindakuii]QCO68269.1 diguanylate cyclase [Luteimonas yindakuii]